MLAESGACLHSPDMLSLSSIVSAVVRNRRAFEVLVVALSSGACSQAGTSPSSPDPLAQGGASPGNAATGGTSAESAGRSSSGASGGDTLGASGSGAGNASSGGLGGAANGASGAAGTAQGGSSDHEPNTPLPSKGCGTTDVLADGERALQVADLARSYVLRKPKGYSPQAQKPWPLVLALHPNGSTSSYWDGTTGSRALRPLFADSAILVMPQARDNDWRGNLPLDLAYFDSLLREVEARLCIDERHIFSMGHSGGGSFSGVLGCSRTDIRAIAASGAVVYFDKTTCVGKPAAWVTLGVDESIPARIDYRDFFRTYAGCGTTGTDVAPSPCVAYDCPDPARAVVFCSHAGGHEWPDFGSQATFDFFSRF